MTGPRELVSDPPIRERLVWHGLLRPEARDFGDLAVAASAFGLVFSIGGIAGLALAVFDPIVEDPGRFPLEAAGLGLIGLICLIGYRRLPRAFFPVAAALGIGLITLLSLASEPGSEPVVAPAYAVIVLLCLLFMPPRLAAAEGVLALAAYGALLFGRHTPLALHLLLSSAMMLALLGLLIWVMRTRTESIAIELSTDAYLDPLTGIPNRRAFDARFDLELARRAREGAPVALVICDLDHFKRVNDEHGHEAGDEVLRRAGAAIAGVTRTADLAARVGGEEFGLILPGTGEEDAAIAAERVRRRIHDEFAPDQFELTISCGIACASDGTGADALYRAADFALYEAKRAGRNCTAIAVGPGDVTVVGGGTPIGRLRQRL